MPDCIGVKCIIVKCIMMYKKDLLVFRLSAVGLVSADRENCNSRSFYGICSLLMFEKERDDRPVLSGGLLRRAVKGMH